MMMFPGVVLMSWMLVLLWLGVSPVAAQQWSVANITTCGLSCLLMTIPEANCSLTDSACQCSSEILPALTSACLLENCTMHDQFVLAKIQSATCSLPHPNRSQEVIVTAVTIFSAAFAFIALRLMARVWVTSTIGLDDWIIALAFALAVPSAAFTVKMCKEGFGKHVWDLDDGMLSRILQSFFIGESVYVIDLALSKISILALYLRLFPYKSIRYAASATIILIVLSTTIIFFMTVFSCHPVAFFWNRDIRGGRCLNVNKLAYANSAMSIIQDLIIIALPLPILAKLNMGRRKKIGVGVMFTLGGFGCIVSMIRLKSLLAFGSSLDPSWDYVNVVIWTAVELAVAMVCASLPAIRQLLARAWPRVFLSSSHCSDDPQPKAVPWDSHTAPGRVADPEGDGFMELQQIRGDVPPEPPPKDNLISVPGASGRGPG